MWSSKITTRLGETWCRDIRKLWRFDKSPQENHNRDINLACFKLNGVLDVSESVLIPIIFFQNSFCRFVDVPMDNNDVNLFWCFRLLHSRLKIETRMQTKTTSKQHFIPGANYMNRRLIIIRRNKRSGKMFAFDDTPTRFYGRSFVNRVDGVFSWSYRILFYLWETCTELENKSATPLLVSDFPVTLPWFSRKKKLACSRRSNAGERRNLIAITIEWTRCMNESRSRKTSTFPLTRKVFHSSYDFHRSPQLNTWDRLRGSRSHK